MPHWEEMEWKGFKSHRGSEHQISDKGAKKFFAVYRTPKQFIHAAVYRTPKQFIHAALTCKRPLDYAFPLPDQLLITVARVVNDGPKLTDLKRKLTVKKVAKWLRRFVVMNNSCTNNWPRSGGRAERQEPSGVEGADGTNGL